MHGETAQISMNEHASFDEEGGVGLQAWIIVWADGGGYNEDGKAQSPSIATLCMTQLNLDLFSK